MEEKKPIDLLAAAPFLFLFALAAFLVDNGKWIREFLSLPPKHIFTYLGVLFVVLVAIAVKVFLSFMNSA
ncbi:MAG: hypothetical protein A2402_01560 [Candidatus Staskawiczbacteria bacterium RIFOXYC1_FULL_37_43]|nr:MAG: hypothetical protein A2813_00050 [Candidatus Staskawiczbacteria bacterium RIFCSPHIGHO2_01_FULL_37_17]OGZ72134.1 MAG: hypothetical protein A2891_01910 [Candidatus Staskawiczbacteria bacterium RIFCSPLOWO2_01_FULL_37_19]OGZ75497.1 MAG: hypothetical protein A2205_01835 [Candidatus Staskawiczbacteria bacterium RIFOXYA1_FULL_37_15]OGZ77531.1 MAG: hypothetical protein A2280_01860 [Candidatus Staskawiczbacteria bacterium RIFOXYA12_FULL_37_10]OGZ80485.1 MAG: hypothetical protein A2353_03100 [Can